MTKSTHLLIIFGATGQQGRSVISHVLHDPELSAQYTLRAITRNPDQPSAQALLAQYPEGSIELVRGDLDSPASDLQSLLESTHHQSVTIFAMTQTIYSDPDFAARETRQAHALAHAAVASGADYLIWSSATHAQAASGGKYSVPTFDVRAEVEAHIRGLPIRSAFVAPASFMQNLEGSGMMAPRRGDGGEYTITNILKPDTKIPWIDVVADLGKFVGMILKGPERYEGQCLAAVSCVYSFEEVAEMIARSSGKKVKYHMVEEEVFRGFLPPVAGVADCVVNMFRFFEEFGYYGMVGKEEEKELVERARELVPGGLVAMEEFVQRIRL
ncbi:NAD(P)-binding protein [Aspergillus saccharolyticus JOP 1030-1]|uniref:NAD(P)-binding protein n=1 Tax=Aspergillus saccharolyticus JOP 1030-1 TaxID=1450539 RepID=A0A318ZGZ5_9EURO|nr:NAD(P)-binding protein [Aspergillus saccharolyticus JOP 1030-1]PYH46826.1 NAD(P)-binding protein [Aspergillus saccharolyticus JOP 1030-1]